MTEQKALMVKDLPEAERPREKLITKGAKALSDAELLAILLRTGTKADSVLRIAEKLLIAHKEVGISGIARLSIGEFSKVKGIGEAKAATVLAALELGFRMAERPSEPRFAIRSPQDVATYVMPRLRYENKEHFMIMLLNAKNHVLALSTISVGSLSASIVHPREVFREALSHSAASVLLIHNHPSGDPSPSKEDALVTQKLVQAGEVMDIAVLDHIIIGDNRFVSLKEEGMIDG